MLSVRSLSYHLSDFKKRLDNRDFDRTKPTISYDQSFFQNKILKQKNNYLYNFQNLLKIQIQLFCRPLQVCHHHLQNLLQQPLSLKNHYHRNPPKYRQNLLFTTNKSRNSSGHSCRSTWSNISWCTSWLPRTHSSSSERPDPESRHKFHR